MGGVGECLGGGGGGGGGGGEGLQCYGTFLSSQLYHLLHVHTSSSLIVLKGKKSEIKSTASILKQDQNAREVKRNT